MNDDGVLMAFMFAFGTLAGLAVAEFYHAKLEDTKTRLGGVMVQQQTRIDALEQYIDDHSETDDDDAELRRMFGKGGSDG